MTFISISVFLGFHVFQYFSFGKLHLFSFLSCFIEFCFCPSMDVSNASGSNVSSQINACEAAKRKLCAKINYWKKISEQKEKELQMEKKAKNKIVDEKESWRDRFCDQILENDQIHEKLQKVQSSLKIAQKKYHKKKAELSNARRIIKVCIFFLSFISLFFLL